MNQKDFNNIATGIALICWTWVSYLFMSYAAKEYPDVFGSNLHPYLWGAIVILMTVGYMIKILEEKNE